MLLANPSVGQLTVIALVSAVGGAVNSIAGGGTLLTFPALLGLGVPPVAANATSTVALWPGSFASMLGYRRELQGIEQWAVRLAIPSVLGGVTGAGLLLATSDERFRTIVPWLVFGATLLFAVQGPIMKWLRQRMAMPHGARPIHPTPAMLVAQFLLAIYGGYFGAGAGIVMLAVFGLMGLTNIHQMNGLKNWGGGLMNLVAVLIFAASGIVDWPVALAMAAGATVGGIGGSLVAQRVGQAWVRRAIVVIGLGSGVAMLFGLI